MEERVLVVDDNEMNRDMLSRRLKRQGYEVETAENGHIALEMMREQAMALVLLDVMMPGITGYEVLDEIKADAELHHIPVIMISAVDDLSSVVKCIEMGADDYLFKPFNPVLLKARVESSIRRANQLRDAGVPAEIHDAMASVVNAASHLNGHVDDPALLDVLHAEIEAMRQLLG